jgi:4a-hydroxytetrahydrobiopterin dehydratase
VSSAVPEPTDVEEPTVPELLSAEEISTALESLPGWKGGPERLERTVPVAAEDRGTLEAAIKAVSEDLNHHPRLERGDGGLRIVLTTTEAGGVTERDVELATHLDRLLSGGVAWDRY